LTLLGQQQATLTGQYFAQQQLDALYTSPLRRARETAEIIGRQIDKTPEIRNGIQEVERFEVSLLAIAEIASIFDPIEDYLDKRAGKTLRWPIQGRVSRAILEIIKAHPDQRVVVVAHAGVVSSVLAWVLPEERLKWWRTTVENCSLTQLRIDETNIEVVAVNQIQHLSPAEATAQPPDPAVEATKAIMETVKPTKN
jgi:broad specificity phosphatase PhoE